jgi:hypothetical protein
VDWLCFWLGDYCFELGRWFVRLLGDMVSMDMMGGMLFVELTEVAVGWLWRNGMTNSMPEVELGLFDKLVVEKARDKMESIAGDGGSNTQCGWLL